MFCSMLLREEAETSGSWEWSIGSLIRASRTALVWHTARFRHKLLRLAHTPLDRMSTSTEQHAECAICFEDLCAQQIVTFEKKRGLKRRLFRRPARRVCGHFFHESCAAQLKPQLCPLCRTPFHRCRRVPSIEEDPLGWFQCVDVDGEGRLSRDQVKDALATCFPLDVPRLEASFDELWAQWDVTGSGYIDKPSFLTPGEARNPVAALPVYGYTTIARRLSKSVAPPLSPPLCDLWRSVTSATSVTSGALLPLPPL